MLQDKIQGNTHACGYIPMTQGRVYPGTFWGGTPPPLKLRPFFPENF